MVDILSLLATAQRLITENGRSVTFVDHSEVLSNTSKPWLGPTSARTPPKATLVIDAVFVEPALASKFGVEFETEDLIKNAKQIMMVSTTTDLSIFEEVIDGEIYWKIIGLEILKPGKIAILEFVLVAR